MKTKGVCKKMRKRETNDHHHQTEFTECSERECVSCSRNKRGKKKAKSVNEQREKKQIVWTDNWCRLAVVVVVELYSSIRNWNCHPLLLLLLPTTSNGKRIDCFSMCACVCAQLLPILPQLYWWSQSLTGAEGSPKKRGGNQKTMFTRKCFSTRVIEQNFFVFLSSNPLAHIFSLIKLLVLAKRKKPK